jgi:hypothetical protein
MAGVKIDNFSTSDVNLTAIMDTLQATRQGHFRLSLTEMDTTDEPVICAGSIIDLNGSLIYFNDDKTITGTPADGNLYIKLIYSSSTVTAEYTSTSPTFDTSKNGWYGTGESAGHRYIAKMIKSGTSYTGKMYYDSANMLYSYETQTASWSGTWNASETKTATLTYTNNVLAIADLYFNALVNSGGYNISIDSIVINTNTIVFTMTKRTALDLSGIYNIVCSAVSI